MTTKASKVAHNWVATTPKCTRCGADARRANPGACVRAWPRSIELSVFNGPEVLTSWRVLSDSEAMYRAGDGQCVVVVRDERGFITQRDA